jgi:hypothetical protein
VIPAIPFPITTTRWIEGSAAASSNAATRWAGGFGRGDSATGPRTRAQHAIRCPLSSPSRSRVVRSESSTGERFSSPSSTQIGSEPHMPMRHPASIARPLRSIASSNVVPGSTASRRRSGRIVTSGRSRLPAALIAASACLPTRIAGGAATSAKNRCSLRQLRATQTSVNASSSARDGQTSQAGAVSAIRRDSWGTLNQ